MLTDLDGTLLDHGGILVAEARAALDALRRSGVPVIPLTSKTEVELRRFLSENELGGIGSFGNGAGVIDPRGDEVVMAARPAEVLFERLAHLSTLSGVPLTPISHLSPEELTKITGLSEARLPAMLARRWGLPFLAPAEAGPELVRAAGRMSGIRLTRGGIFWHLSGDHGKEDALHLLFRRKAISRPIAGLGDAPNDAGFLALCDVSFLIPGEQGEVNAELSAAVPAGRRVTSPGGRGWAEAVHYLLGELT